MKAVRQIKRHSWLALAILATMLAVSGCVQVQFTSEFQRDGTAIHTLSVVIPREEYEAAEAAGQTAEFDEISESAADAGLQASKIVTRDEVTLRVSTERPDGEDAGAALNSLLNATGINESPGISAPFSGSFQQEGAAVGGTNFVLDMTIDGELLYDTVASTEAAEGVPRSEIEDNVSISYEVSVPGDLVNSTGVEVSPGTVRWDIEPGETISTQTEASAGAPSRAVLFVVAGVASAIGAIVLAVMIGWVLVRRPRLANSISDAATHFPRRTTITHEGIWVATKVRQVVEGIWHRGAPGHEVPIRNDLLDSGAEGSEDGADTEGDRSATGIHGS